MSKASNAPGRRRGARPAKVFISHATADRRRAHRLARLLSDHDIEYWFSREHLVHGEDWYRAIGLALKSCNWLIVVISRAAIGNRWVREELLYALRERRYRNHVIPLLFEDCSLKRLAWSIQSIQYIDFRQGWRQAGDQLVNRLGGNERRTRPRPRAAASTVERRPRRR